MPGKSNLRYVSQFFYLLLCYCSTRISSIYLISSLITSERLDWTDVAYRKLARQSSTYSSSVAALAVDGSDITSSISANNPGEDYWFVDLEKSYSIFRMHIVFRVDITPPGTALTVRILQFFCTPISVAQITDKKLFHLFSLSFYLESSALLIIVAGVPR